MSKLLDNIIKNLEKEVESRKTVIKRNEDHIKRLSSECVERLEIIRRLEGLK